MFVFIGSKTIGFNQVQQILKDHAFLQVIKKLTW